jgi:aminoethylphosphonate catabolism LysR family transcriptional regulator
MRHSQIRAFHYVATYRGFSRAAEALFLTQPAISDQVRKLENHYDMLLFNRQKKQISLTPQGEKLYEITKRLFELEHQILDFLTENKAFTTGTLRIKADSAYHITKPLKKFREAFPDIKVDLKTGNSQDVIDDLLSYDADIGVVGTLPENPKIQLITLGKSPIIAFTARSNSLAKHKSLSIAELADCPLVLREKGSQTRLKLETAALALGITLTPAIEAEGREAVQEIVASGAGIGFVSEKEFSHHANLAAIKIKGAPIIMEEVVAYLKERRGGKLIRTFAAVVRKGI